MRTRQKILEFIDQQGQVTVQEIAQGLQRHTATVRHHIRILMAQNRLRNQGPFYNCHQEPVAPASYGELTRLADRLLAERIRDRVQPLDFCRSEILGILLLHFGVKKP